MLGALIKTFLKRKINSEIENIEYVNSYVSDISDIILEGIMKLKRERISESDTFMIIKIGISYKYNQCKATFNVVNSKYYTDGKEHELFNDIRKVVLLCYKRNNLIPFLKFFLFEIIPDFIGYNDISYRTFTIFDDE